MASGCQADMLTWKSSPIRMGDQFAVLGEHSMSAGSLDTASADPHQNYSDRESSKIRGGFRGEGRGGGLNVFTLEIQPPADPKGPPLYYFEISIFVDGP